VIYRDKSKFSNYFTSSLNQLQILINKNYTYQMVMVQWQCLRCALSSYFHALRKCMYFQQMSNHLNIKQFCKIKMKRN